MIEYIPILINVGATVIAFFWLREDIKEKGIGGKLYWTWIIAFFAGFFSFMWLGAGVVVLIYLIWSRYIRNSASDGQVT